MKLAERGAMLLHQAAGRRLLHRLAMKTQDDTLGKSDPTVDQQLEAEDMQVRIGDEINHYGIVPQKSQATASQPTSMRGLKKIALAAALLGAGVGIGAAVPLVIDALKPGTPATVPADNDTLYELQIGGDRP